MADAIDFFGTAFKNGSLTLLARVVGGSGANIVRADLASAKYSIFLLDDQNPNHRDVVTGHDNVTLTVADVVFDTLQTATIWTADTTGYNFRHTLDVGTNPAFAIAGRRYLVEYRLVPVSGQVILVRFRINVI
jgi:hypothetical protein